MALILVAFALLSLFTNYQKAHRKEIETVTITPFSTPAPAATPIPSPEVSPAP